MQYNAAFAKETKLIFLLDDQQKRHAAIYNVSAKVSSKHGRFEKFSEYVNENNFVAELEFSMKHPKSDRAKKLLDELLPCVEICGGVVPFSPIQRKQSLNKLYGMVQHFGLPSWFITITPSEIDSYLVMRLCFRNPNASPIMEKEKFEHWNSEQNTEFGTINIPIPAAVRALVSASDPVACAEFFQRLVETVLSTLFFSENDKNIKKSSPISTNLFGVFGRINAHFLVFEVQGRGALHLHGLLWGSITPYVMQIISTKKGDILNLLTKAVDSMVQAYLPLKAFQDQITRKQNPSLNIRPGLQQFSFDKNNPEDFIDRYGHVCSAVQVHKHSFTCHKGKAGKFSCRLGYPSNMQPEKTQPLEIVLLEHNKVRVNRDIEPFVQPEVMKHYPFDIPDIRTIVYSLKRPYNQGLSVSDPLYNRNGLVVPFNPACSAVLGCNTAMMLLGSIEQCKTAIFYTLDYMTKDAQALENSLSVIYNAKMQISKNQSKASDSGSAERNTKHILQRIVNNLSGQVETSAMMAAASLLGMPSTMCSHSFWFCYIRPAIHFVKQILTSTDAIFSDIELTENDTDENSDDLFDDVSRSQTSSDAGTSQIFEIQGKYIAVHQHIHYAYRGLNLRHLSFYEYCGIIQISKKKFVNKNSKQNKQQHEEEEKEEEAAEAEVEEEVEDEEKEEEEVEEQEEQEEGDDDNDEDEEDGKEESGEGVEEQQQEEHEEEKQNEYGASVNGSHRTSKGSRQKNKSFNFDDGHPLKTHYFQKIRSKLLVPILAGTSPPYLPFPPPDFESNSTWINQSEKFAEYYLTLMVPWDIDRKIPLPIESIDSEFDVLSYKTFCDWALMTLSTEASFIDKCRLTSIDNIATSLRVDKIRKKTVTIWRAQSAKRWEDGMGYSSLRTDGDVGELSPLNDSETDRPPDEIQSIINYLQELAHSNSARPKNLLALTFLEKQSKELCKLFSTENEATNVAISGILLN